MLRSSSAGPKRKYQYSLIACMNASREALSRYIALRSFNCIAWTCRTVDFLALMAAMTVLLAHLDSHLSETGNLLAHQYHSDRAMIEKVQENMKEVNRLNSDTLSARSADLLGRLMAIELDTTNGDLHSARRVSVQGVGVETTASDSDDDTVVSVHIPYFGIIKIARQGISKEVPPMQGPDETNLPPTQSQKVAGPGTARTEIPNTEPQIRPLGFTGPRGTQIVASNGSSEACYGHLPELSNTSSPYPGSQGQSEAYRIPAYGSDGGEASLTLPLHNSFTGALLKPSDYPPLAAGGEDWAFQGVDMAFFGNLMRSAGTEGDGVVDWAGANPTT